MKDRFTRNPTAHDHWVKGNDLFDQGKILPAIDYFKNAVRADGNFAEAYSNMGIAYFEMKDYRNAQECFKKAVLIKPDFVEALLNLGSAYLFDEQPIHGLEVQTTKPRLQDAAMAYEQVVNIKPELPEPICTSDWFTSRWIVQMMPLKPINSSRDCGMGRGAISMLYRKESTAWRWDANRVSARRPVTNR